MLQKPRFMGCIGSLQGKKSPIRRFLEALCVKRNKLLVTVLFLVFFSGNAAWAQSSSTSSGNLGSTQFDMTGFPQWARDLRRGEIVAFGSFPFAFFFTNFAYDMYRSATHGWDRRYAPWPVKAAGAVELTKKEQMATLGIAAGGAVLIAVVDHLIVRYRRNKRESEIRSLPAGTPIIIRRPMGEEPDEADSGSAEKENLSAESGNP
jgi:hypothetical protein